MLLSLFGLCAGEEFIPFPANWLIGLSALIALLPIEWFLGCPSKVLRWVFPLMLSGLLLFSFYLGGEDLGRAYQNCMEQGEKLRSALSHYKKAHGTYPDSLAQLGWKELPGGRRVGKSILYYEGDKEGYEMHFSGGPTCVKATESEPFEQLFM